MKTAGIIAEYNPFHNGHKYHIEQTKKITGADYVIAVISGDFMQRGMPAVTDKYARTQMALKNGADLVLELPLYYAAASAEFFSLGSISLLDKLGITDFLCFGSESGDIRMLSAIAAILIEEPASYKSTLQAALKKGFSFPKARALALEKYVSGSKLQTALSSPNNILGIEYLKALLKRDSSIKPYTITRAGAAYHDTELFSGHPPGSSPRSSASAIRHSLDTGSSLHPIKNHVPETVYEILRNINGKSFPVISNDFSLLLRYKLITAPDGYTDYMDINEDMSDKIKKNLNQYLNYEQFCGLLKSKNNTYSGISRCLLHILLDMKKESLAGYTAGDYISYARVLGFRKDSSPLMHAIKKHSSIPLITKLTDAPALLTPIGADMLKKDITAAHIYDSVISDKFKVPFINEHSKEIIIY